MLDLKSIMIGVLCGIALVFVLGASHKKGKKGTPPVGMFQLYAIPNSDSKAVILHNLPDYLLQFQQLHMHS